jgi:hypothetical protein
MDFPNGSVVEVLVNISQNIFIFSTEYKPISTFLTEEHDWMTTVPDIFI